MDEEEEVMDAAREFDSLACYEQVDLVLNMLRDADENEDFELVRATLIPLALIRNRVKALEGIE